MPLTSGALLDELAQYSCQRVTLLLQGSGEPLSLLGLLLVLSEACLHILRRHMLALGASLCFSKGSVLQHELGPRLAQRRVLLLKFPPFCLAAWRRAVWPPWPSAPRGAVGIAFLLRTAQLALLRFEARLCLIHLIAKALHRGA